MPTRIRYLILLRRTLSRRPRRTFIIAVFPQPIKVAPRPTLVLNINGLHYHVKIITIADHLQKPVYFAPSIGANTIRNENLVMASLSTPRIRPVEIVAPDREMPGSIATAWAIPINTDFEYVILPFGFFKNLGHSNLILTAGGGSYGHVDGAAEGARSQRQAEMCWREGADPIEFAKEHKQFARAFISFESDADDLYPGWREQLKRHVS